jgi:hypothetical protein
MEIIMAGEINVSISQESVQQIIDAKVREAVAGALGRDPKYLIDNIVRMALEEKSRDSYGGRQTIFAEAVSKMIREEALRGIQEWIEENRPLMRKVIHERIRARKGFAQKLADNMTDALAKSVAYNIKVVLDGEE